MDTRGRGQNRAYRSKPDTTRWQHDKYDEADQTPKSRSKLIEEYGFDIRSFQYGEVPSRSRRGRPNRGRFNQPERSRFPRRQEEDWNEPPSKPPTAIRTQDFRAKRREDSRDVQQPAPKTNMDDVLNVINDRES
uniref:Protein CASC3 n=1 Tax=Ciona savignyi TaxID=51511 RepID=H2ZI52_CIOSA